MKDIPKRWGSRHWADLPLRLKGSIVIALPLAALLLTTFFYFLTERTNREADRWVAHTYEVREQIDRILATLVDAETGVRGYLLSGDAAFLQIYSSSTKAIPRELTRLERLVQDSAPQRQRQIQLQSRITQRLHLLEQTRRYRTGNSSALNAPTIPQELLQKGRVSMLAVRGVLSAMRTEEDDLLSRRLALAEHARGRQNLAVMGGAVTGLGGGLLALLLFIRGITDRIERAEKNATRLSQEGVLVTASASEDEIGRLEKAVAEASSLLSTRRRDLLQSQARLQAIFDSTQDAILLIDDAGHFVDANPAATTLLSYSREELLQRGIKDVLPPKHLKMSQTLWKGFMAQGRQSNEFMLLCRGGGLVETHYRAVANITPGLHLAVIQDISERKQAEKTLHAEIVERQMAVNALREVYSVAEERKEEAERANAAKSEFLSRMSHELRTPLNAILGFAQVLEMGDLKPDQEDSVKQILRGGHHLLELINEVLDISRIETGQMALSLEAVKLGEVLQEAIDLIGSLAASHNVRLSEISCEHYVTADRQRVKQVLLNLLSNAVKYNSEGGRVLVSCEIRTGYQTASGEQAESDSSDGQSTAAEPGEEGVPRLRVAVSDTGAGIPNEQLKRLFNPFDRLGAERTSIEGTGIGLALAKRLVELMDGVIGVDSVPGEGTTFWFELPFVQGPEPVPPSLTSAGKRGGEAPLVEQTILYIEDNLSNLRLIEAILERRSGVQLLSSTHGGSGLSLARKHKPDLILLDLHLPDMNGDEVLRQLLANGPTSRIPVVMLSADATPRQVERLLEIGAKAYLTKPINVQRFLQLLDETLATKHQA